MGISTEQLEAINQEITKAFSDDPRISIIAADGNPPDKYEVTYQVEGLQKTDAGAIEKTDSHTIAISIPFGYPHFPPSCKPKSPVFHPDFDPAAICIGDFWEKNRSIVDLITHIGEMITGTFYSTSNAFNEEAAQWYEENFAKSTGDDTGTVDRLDFDAAAPAFESAPEDDFTSLLQDDVEGALEDDLLEPFDPAAKDSVEPALSFVDDSEVVSNDTGADSVGDIFEESDFDFEEPRKNEKQQDNELLPAELTSGDIAGEMDEEDVDVDHFQELAGQKRFFGLDKELSLLPADVVFDGKEALAEQAAVALEQAQALYAQALEFEHQGDPDKALKYLEKIHSHTTDYPGLHEDISRMTQALELLGDWTVPTMDRDHEAEDKEESPAKKEKAPPPPPPKSPPPQPRQPKDDSRTFFEGEPEQKSRLGLYAIGIILILVSAAAGVNYYLSSSKYAQAQQQFSQCQAALARNQFSDAELQCESALGLAKQITLFKGSDRDSLIMDIEKMLRSKPLEQGLAGNLLLDGEYYPKQVVQNIVSFREFKQKGDDFFTASQWQQSISNYEQALEIAAGEKAIDRQELFAISENVKIARFNIAYQAGLSFIQRKEWILATRELSEALEQLKTLSIPDKDKLIDTITARLDGIEQATEKEKGDAAFAEAQWAAASTHYRKALEAANQSLEPDDELIYQLKQLVVKGDLYGIVSAGKTAFRQARWDEAISNYDKAINLLEDNRELLKQANTEENRKKLARIMLQASLIRDKQDAARHLKEKEFDQAIDKLQAMINSISASEFNSEVEFKTISEETEQSIVQAEADELLASKIEYLEVNFEELFTRHYSGSPPESLIEREVVFEKKMDSKLIFRLQCVEVGRGRPLQLVMKYTHDLNSGEWRFYSDSQ